MWQSEQAFRRGVSISLGDFAVIELAIYEFKEGGALLRSEVKLFVDGTSHRVKAGPLSWFATRSRLYKEL